jgi:hypothetical protein
MSEGKMNIEKINDVAMATIKGAVGNIPFAGPFLSEYIGLAQERIADKRIKEWMEMVESKIEKLNCDMDKLSNNELFYTALHIATNKAMKEYEKGKREYFANAIYNTVYITDLSEEKKMVFFFLLEKYTLSSMKLLKLFSENNYRESDYIEKSGMVITRTQPGQEKLIKYILQYIKEFEGEAVLVKNLTTQLFYDGLIEDVDFNMPEYPKQSRRKRSTSLGDDFLKFIAD